ncbi:thiol peroxidase [Mycoplasmatota bacterium WC44]
MKITFGGNPVTLLGEQLNVGDTAPNFTLLGNDLSEKTLDDFSGLKVLNIVPSLDTGVCDAQTRRFNQDVTNATVITVSYDLPFAQARWCGASGLENVITLSAHKDESFATDYGVLIKELRLTSRAVLILDENNKVIYTDYVSEVTDHPNYEEALNILSK